MTKIDNDMVSLLKEDLQKALDDGEINDNFWYILKQYHNALKQWLEQFYEFYYIDSTKGVQTVRPKKGKGTQIIGFKEKVAGIETGIQLLENLREVLLGEEILYVISKLEYIDEVGIPQEDYSQTAIIKHSELLKDTDTYSNFHIEDTINNLKDIKKQLPDMNHDEELQNLIDSTNEKIKNLWGKKFYNIPTYYRLSTMNEESWKNNFKRVGLGTDIQAYIEEQTFGERWNWWFSNQQQNHTLRQTGDDRYYIDNNKTLIVERNYKKHRVSLTLKKYETFKVSLYALKQEKLYNISGNRGHELEAFFHGLNERSDENGCPNTIVDDIAIQAKGNLKYYQGPDVTVQLTEPRKLLLQIKRVNARISLQTTYNGIKRVVSALDEVFKRYNAMKQKGNSCGYSAIEKLSKDVVLQLFKGNAESKLIQIAYDVLSERFKKVQGI